MEKIIGYIKKYKGLFIIGIVILGLTFYWYEYRPSQITKKCVNLVNNQKSFNPQKFADEYTGKTYFDETGYKKCLRKNGINE